MGKLKQSLIEAEDKDIDTTDITINELMEALK